MLVSDGPERYDASHMLTHHVQLSLPAFDDAMSEVMLLCPVLPQHQLRRHPLMQIMLSTGRWSYSIVQGGCMLSLYWPLQLLFCMHWTLHVSMCQGMQREVVRGMCIACGI